MGKIPVRMKAVIYSLSPFQQQVMSGLWKDLPHKLTKKVSENWISASLLIGPLLGTHFFLPELVADFLRGNALLLLFLMFSMFLYFL
ncbi:hypothetical protein MKW92_046107 [Papaver armeniacum]|nr:hypothetical protein MKW92_046107 [Papaver armeniacum]